MKRIKLGKSSAAGAPKKGCFLATGLAGVVAAAMLAFTFVPVASAGEEAGAGPIKSSGGDIMICLREQNPLGGFGPERCITQTSLTAGLGAGGFGPAASWVEGNLRPVQPATEYHFINAYARPEFKTLDIEQTTRIHAPVAIWLLSFNVKELASTFPQPEKYWTPVRLDGHQSIGLTALDPGIQRNPTGLKAIGLRISVPY